MIAKIQKNFTFQLPNAAFPCHGVLMCYIGIIHVKENFFIHFVTLPFQNLLYESKLQEKVLQYEHLTKLIDL